jgi:hypothetical protein
MLGRDEPNRCSSDGPVEPHRSAGTDQVALPRIGRLNLALHVQVNYRARFSSVFRIPGRQTCIQNLGLLTPDQNLHWIGRSIRHRRRGLSRDRLTHHAHILEMNGESYRIKDGKRRRPGDVCLDLLAAPAAILTPRGPEPNRLIPDFHFERDGPNLLMLSYAFIHAGSNARNTRRRHTPSG